MNWAECKDPVSHMCLANTVVASWSVTQEVAGLSPSTVMTNILSLNSLKCLPTPAPEYNWYPLEIPGINHGLYRLPMINSKETDVLVFLRYM